MSRASGEVIFNKDNERKYFIYDGTTDLCKPQLFEKLNNAWETYRNGGIPFQTCVCGNEEPVRIRTDYGSGLEWEGTACRHCNRITNDSVEADYSNIERHQNITIGDEL